MISAGEKERMERSSDQEVLECSSGGFVRALGTEPTGRRNAPRSRTPTKKLGEEHSRGGGRKEPPSQALRSLRVEDLSGWCPRGQRRAGEEQKMSSDI